MASTSDGLDLSSQETASARQPAVAWTPGVWGTLIVLCGALFLDGLDVSMVGVALPSLEADLGLSTSALQWVVSGYVLGYGGLLLLGGRTTDLLGRRRVFLVAIGVFAVASLLGGVVSNGTALIVARFVKGAAAAFTAPAGLSIITTTFPEGPARNRAVSVYSATGASGFSLGLILGGLMTEVGWRWTFLLPAPIAVVVLLAGGRLIPRDRDADRVSGRYDILGALLSTSAMLLLVYAIVSAPDAGWGSARTLVALAVVVALAAAFVVVERRTAHPLVRLGVLRSSSLVRANVAALTVFGAYVGFQFIGTLYMQNLLGWSPLEMALAFLPGGLIVTFGGQRTGGLVNRIGSARVLVLGALAFVAGYALFLRIGPEPHYLSEILPSILLVGTGFALSFPAFNIQATAGVADHEQGLASGLVQTSFQIGGAVGLAAVTAVVAAYGGATAQTPEAVLHSYYPALAAVTGVAVVGLLVALTGSHRRH
ncbi:MAG: MFS transporter [Micromonosporaceae bacterium]|nr:MFS transporter [Micromonosporaceae bacterium]